MFLLPETAFAVSMLVAADARSEPASAQFSAGVVQGYSSYSSRGSNLSGAFAGAVLSYAASSETSFICRLAVISVGSDRGETLDIVLPSAGLRLAVDATPIEPYVAVSGGYYGLRSTSKSLSGSRAGLSVVFGMGHRTSTALFAFEVEYHSLRLNGADSSTLETYPLFTAGTRIELRL